MNFKKVLSLASVGLLATSLAACGKKVTDADHEKWAAENGWVKLDPELANATAEGRMFSYGDIKFNQAELKSIVTEFFAGPYTWGQHEPKQNVTAAEKFESAATATAMLGTPLHREMVVFNTSYNNVPNTSTIEVVMDPYTGYFYGSSEAKGSKVAEMKANPNVTITLVGHFYDKDYDDLGDGWRAFSDYGYTQSLMIYGKVYVIQPSYFDDPTLTAKAVRAMDVYQPTYYSQNWPYKVINSHAAHDYSQDPQYAAKQESVKNVSAGCSDTATSVKYWVEPVRITISTMNAGGASKTKDLAANTAFDTYFKFAPTSTKVVNGTTETYTAVPTEQYLQASIAFSPDNAGRCWRYAYMSDKTYNFTWNEVAGKKVQLASVEETNVPYETPYWLRWSREEYLEAVTAARQSWYSRAENEAFTKNKFGSEASFSYERYVYAAAEGTHAAGDPILDANGKYVTAQPSGDNWKKQVLVIPNYGLALYSGSIKTLCGLNMQQNLTEGFGGNN